MLQIKGTDKFVSDLRRMSKEFDKEMDFIIQKSTKDVESNAKKRAKFGVYETGRLRSSINSMVKGKDGEIKVNANYSPYVEFGTGKGVDVPKGLENYAIQFKGKGIKEVNNRAQPFLFPALFQEQEKFFKNITKAYEKIFR